jgi:hypothetical protein
LYAPVTPLGGGVAEADPAVIEEAGKSIPALEQIVDRLGDAGRARQAGTFLAQAGIEPSQKRSVLLLADTQALLGAHAIDGALDVE